MIIRLATRKSPLALWQANSVKQQLQNKYPHVQVELVKYITAGDKKTDQALSELGGKSLFVKELQIGLLENTADIAVHSVKDMSVTACPGLILAAILKREDPRDAFISNICKRWQDLPSGAIVGTASPRRQCQIYALRPDLRVAPLRGNVETRLSKLTSGQYHAVILASAGLIRLGLETQINQYLPIHEFIPAIGQGALGIECRTDDHELIAMIQALNDRPTQQCVNAERALNARLGGDCYTPVGAYAQIQGEELVLQAMIGSTDGRVLLKAHHRNKVEQAELIGIEVAEKLLAQGADKLCHKN